MSMVHSIRLVLEPARTVLRSGAADADVVLPLGAMSLAASFRQDPVGASDLERAIDLVEDAIASLGSHAASVELVTDDISLRALPGLGFAGARLTLDEVEGLFQRLASVSLGSPAASSGLTTGQQSAAALLILRECMHHLGYQVVRVG